MKQYNTPKDNEPSERAKDFFNSLCTTHIDTVSYVFSRWLDEYEYEDIKDYQKPLNKIAESFGVVITKMIKKPFGFHFTADNRTFVFKIKTNGSLSFQRIK